MSSTPPDQTALMKEVLEALKALQVNQVQLASNVDAITGRVNVLAGMKEVRDVASTNSPSVPVKISHPISSVDESHSHDDDVPQSPSLSATHVDGDGSSSPSSHISNARKPSVTSRIILT
jgi:hypothetical protein